MATINRIGRLYFPIKAILLMESKPCLLTHIAFLLSWMGLYGAESWKPTQVFGTASGT